MRDLSPLITKKNNNFALYKFIDALQKLSKGLTPSKSTEFKDIGRNIDIEDFHKSQVHVNRL